MRLSPCSFNLAIDNTLLPSVRLIGGDTGFPDWSSLKTRTSLDPIYATVMCRIARDVNPSESTPEVAGDQCPRHALATVVDKAFQQFGIRFLIGFEVEFEVFTRNALGKIVPFSCGLGGGAVAGLRDPSYKHVEEAMQILLEAGVGLEAIHTEGPKGQYEFCLAPKPPMEAVDELILVHDTLKTVFSHHGLVATMFPRPAASRSQSIGQHTHISIDKPDLEESFLAGMLQRLPELSALCLPYELSYERLQPGQAGARFVAWGTQDRRVPIRKIKKGHWEIRCVDATANMYLGLAAMLSAGLLGCVNSEPLLLRDSVVMDDVASGEYMPFPHSLDMALGRLENGFEELDGFMGSRVLEYYLHLKRYEALKMKELGVEESRSWLLELF